MAKRKKRLKKGIESLYEQIEEHEKKLEEALREEDYERAWYYRKEIKTFLDGIEKKEKQLKKRKKK